MFFRNTSISTKMTMMACGAALLIACAGFAWHTVDSLCETKGNQLRDQAEFIAWQAVPVLALRDAEGGQKLLASFWTNSTVEEARLYVNDRDLLATWGDQSSLTAPASTPEGFRYVGFSQVEVVHDVVVGSQRLGTVYVRANTSDLMERLAAFTQFAGFIAALAMLVVLLVAIRLRQAISRPLSDLAKTADRIANNADSSIRIHSDAQAELKTLQDAFNHMLARIQSSEAAVRKAHLGLEDGVIARTKELSKDLRRHQERTVGLENAKDAAEAANQAKTEFLVNLNREIRTPLSEVMRLTEVLMNEPSDISPEDRQERLTTIHRHGARLVELINDLPDVSKSEAGRLELERVTCSPHQVISDERATGLLQTVDAGADATQPPIRSDNAPTPAAGATPSRDVRLAGKRILVVDDGEFNRKLIQRVLHEASAEVLTANDGFQAIHSTIRNHPELILMDMQMPVMDGYSATQELRSNGHALPIIALLAEAMKGDKEKCLQAGCTSYVTKPIEPAHLLEVIVRELNATVEHVTT